VLELYAKKEEKKDLAFWTEIEGDNLTPEFYNPKYKEVELELQCSPFKVYKLKELITEMFCGRTEYGSKRVFQIMAFLLFLQKL
jgi:hypothetical protein